MVQVHNLPQGAWEVFTQATTLTTHTETPTMHMAWSSTLRGQKARTKEVKMQYCAQGNEMFHL